MFKKVFSFVFVLIMSIVQVEASTQKGLKAAFNELQYSLAVEWDQKDQQFFNQKSEQFTQELKRIQKSGVSNQELLENLLNEIQDKKLARDIETTFSLVSLNSLTPDEAVREIKTALEKDMQRGASWNGSSVIFGMVLMIAIIAVAGVVYKDELKKEGEKCYMAWKCHEYCTLTGCEQVCGEECI